jgi:hypothetical protein
MIRWLLAVVAVVSLQPAMAAEKLDKALQWRMSEGGNGHWYQAVLVPERINWAEANVRATARGCGWHLATISSEAEDRFVFGLIASKPAFFLVPSDRIHGPWLGGFQRNAANEPAGNWRWVTQEKSTFTNWAEGEPNNQFLGPEELAPGVAIGSSEDFLHYKVSTNGNGRKVPIWNDVPGNALLAGYLLETEHPYPRYCEAFRRHPYWGHPYWGRRGM